MRRFPGRCYYCGDPVVLGAQFCIAHLWAQGIDPPVRISKKVLDALAYIRPEKR